MSNYQLKSENSIAAGTLLQKEEKYDNSIHCFYYACVQMMILVKETNPIVQRNFNRSTALGIHQQLITAITNDLNTRSFVDFLQFNNEIHILRSLRVIGDYKEVLITVTEANEASLYSENIITLLRRTYSI